MRLVQFGKIGVVSALLLAGLGCSGSPPASTKDAQGLAAGASGNRPERTEEKLMTNGTAKVIRDGDRVCIDGFQKAVWHEKNSVIATIAGAMTAMGEDVTYEYLMGVSGQAFRVQFHQPDGCPSSACAPCGFNCMNVALEALGYDVTWYPTEKDTASQELARQAVVQAVDSGRPALLASEECGLIVGYAKGGQELLCREYHAGGKEGYTAMKNWPWTVAVFGQKRATKERSGLVRESLGRAIALYNAPDMPEPKKYAEGLKAYQLWIALLEDDSRVEKLTKDSLFSVALANAHCYYCLMDARAAGAKYLRSIAPQFKPDAAARLVQAAGLYEQIAQTIRQGRTGLPPTAGLFPWKLDGGKAWTSEMRHLQAAILKDCVKLEQQTLAQLSRAATIEGIPVPELKSGTKPYGVEVATQPSR